MTKSNDRERDTPTTDTTRGWRQVAQRHFDPAENTQLTTALIFALADAKDIAPSELKSPILYDCVDVAALEAAFFGPDVDGHSRQSTGSAEFRYDGCLVKLKSDGWIQVYEPSQ